MNTREAFILTRCRFVDDVGTKMDVARDTSNDLRIFNSVLRRRKFMELGKKFPSLFHKSTLLLRYSNFNLENLRSGLERTNGGIGSTFTVHAIGNTKYFL